jgi:serine protease Do
MSGSPAEKGRMKTGDIIRTFDRKPVENVRELLKLVGRAPIGKKTKVVVLRDKKEITLEIEVAQRPEAIEEFADEELGSWRGIEVMNKDGVTVSNVEPGSSADIAGLRRGDKILEINRKAIKDITDYNKATKGLSGDVLLLTNRGYAVIKEEPKEGRDSDEKR